MNSEGASSIGDMTTSAPTGGPDPTSSDGAGTRQHPTTASTVDLPPATTESPENPPSDASAAMEVVEEVLTRTAAGGNIRKEAPYTAKDFLLTSSTGATHTNSRKKGKKKPTKKRPPATASEGTAANLPQPFSKAPHCSGHHKEAQQCGGESPQTQRASRWSPPKAPDAVPGTLLLLRPSRSTLPSLAQFCSGRQPPEVPSVDPHASSSHRHSLQGPAWLQYAKPQTQHCGC
ncbi:hypothetical protein MRX96_006036 [Rhipicephalus microplus]